MFDNVGNALVVFGGGGECDADSAVIVVGGHHDDPCPRPVVGVEPDVAPDIADITALGKCVIIHN